MTTSRREILLAYRHLYRHLLRAVQYSKPARYVVRDRLRNAFRTSPNSAYDAQRIATTLEFLDGARRVRGLEHKILKNWVHVCWDKGRPPPASMRKPELEVRRMAYEHFDQSVEKLNETMGLCIK